VEALELRPDPSLVLSLRMGVWPVQMRTLRRNLNLAMPQPVGQHSLNGQLVKEFVVKMVPRQGKGHALSLQMEASHALRRQLKQRLNRVTPLGSAPPGIKRLSIDFFF